ncbi:hypothetical protein SAMN02745728_00719 [Desulfovibrio litoralis DSM 11393]|uniref:Uncharacterized protein n=1 Tax=Desulfovibrio litoralis DSM 11393 TaxID=1121455 RepID=A0A1M7SBA2_9BACT|nr:hypothetical protein SAMN02745728_00719 [Desulfovibrio litoralis DSM 11393]
MRYIWRHGKLRVLKNKNIFRFVLILIKIYEFYVFIVAIVFAVCYHSTEVFAVWSVQLIFRNYGILNIY